jgi:hypothetical protein
MAEGTRMQQRRATEAVWVTSNYVLAAGELGVTTDTGIIKVGNGTSHWTDLNIAFSSQYLPLLGKAADADLLDGIGSEGFVKFTDTSTAATADKVVKRLSDGKVKAVAGAATDEVVNYDQLVAGITTARQELVSRSVTASITLALTDAGCLVNMGNSAYSPVLTCTVPPNSSVAFPIGSYVDVATTNKGAVVLTAGSGVTINGFAILYGGYSSARLVKTATNTWQTVLVQNSAGPILHRKILTGASNTLTNGAFVKLRLDGADSGTALYTNNADTLGAGEQWSSADNFKAYCRRGGWYSVAAQVAMGVTGNARAYTQIRVNNIEQHFGSGAFLGSSSDMGTRTRQVVPLSVGDYVEVYGYQDTGADRQVVEQYYNSSFFEWAWLRPL